MNLNFGKYHGNGNDFIILDNRTSQLQLSQAEVAFLCDRNFGIGADGLILVGKDDGFDFSLTYFNSDGLESSMCGNGGRCATAFALRAGIIKQHASFMAADGIHHSEVLSAENETYHVRLKMKDVTSVQKYDDGYFLDTGSPHFVKFVLSADEVDVNHQGRSLRNEPRFSPGGANINFAEKRTGEIYVRTYERGVENETLSCGTGVTAAALVVASISGNELENCKVSTRGGKFNVLFQKSGQGFHEVFLEGPAVFVFEGTITI